MSDIPGFMSAMTMPYRVKDAKDLDRMTPGDAIQADVVVSGERVWLENIVIVKGNSPPPRLPPANCSSRNLATKCRILFW